MDLTIEDLDRILEAEHGRVEDRYQDSFPAQGGGDPLDTLILTILSQATSDTNSLRAYRQLRQRFPTWEEVLAAGVEEVAEALRPGGLGPQKAGRIQEILRRLKGDHGHLTLDYLTELDTEEAYRHLLSFPGVGPKTAACVLLFALNRPRFPVDTHVARILRRLGVVEDRATPVAIQEQMERQVPEDLKLGLHLNLIEHGRKICSSRAPRCNLCVLRKSCRNPVSLRDPQ